MNNKYLVTTTVLIATLAIGSVSFAQRGAQRGFQRGIQRGMRIPPAEFGAETPELSTELRNSLLHMREEEKLARDVYRTLGEKYSTPVFSHIAAAESRHMAALETLLSRYGLPDPVVDDTVGKFTKPEFSKLYSDLVAQGSQSLSDAYQVGALIEELDIYDLHAGKALVAGYSDIEWVYENLTRGSRNHLRAFAAQLAAAGQSYEAQHLSQQEFDEIAASAKERGNRGSGKGEGRGRRFRASSSRESFSN